MPTYEFRCPNGHEFNRFYKTMSTALSELPCPECNALATRQLSAGAGLVFKGSGFYLTDYGKNAHRADGGTRTADGAKAESKAASDSASKADGATPTTDKPAKSEGKGDGAGSAPKGDSHKGETAKGESTKPKPDTSKPKPA